MHKLQNEEIINIKVSDNVNTAMNSMLYCNYISDNYEKVIYVSQDIIIEEIGKFTTCLENILSTLTKGTVFHSESHVRIRKGALVEVCKIDEFISFDETTQSLKFKLECNIDGVDYSAEALDEFDEVISRLANKLVYEIQVCALCKNGNITSLSDLRRGWHCFREIENQKPEIPWFQRDEEFDNSISKVGALHWCPSFEKRT